jgi:hypothetical protein
LIDLSLIPFKKLAIILPAFHVCMIKKTVITENENHKKLEGVKMNSKENHTKPLILGMGLSTLSTLVIFFLIKPFLLDAVSSTLIELFLWIR